MIVNFHRDICHHSVLVQSCSFKWKSLHYGRASNRVVQAWKNWTMIQLSTKAQTHFVQLKWDSRIRTDAVRIVYTQLGTKPYLKQWIICFSVITQCTWTASLCHYIMPGLNRSVPHPGSVELGTAKCQRLYSLRLNCCVSNFVNRYIWEKAASWCRNSRYSEINSPKLYCYPTFRRVLYKKNHVRLNDRSRV